MAAELKLVELKDLTPKGRRQVEAICRLAPKILSEKGYWATSMTDIAVATGVSKGGLYHYFQTKEQLLYLIIHRYLDRMLAGLRDQVGAIASPRDKISFLVRRHIDLYADNVHESRLMFHDMHLLPPNLFDLMVEKSREYRRVWTEAVGALDVRGGWTDGRAKMAALSLLGMCNWVYLWYDPAGRVSPEQLTRQICDIFFGEFGRALDRGFSSDGLRGTRQTGAW